MSTIENVGRPTFAIVQILAMPRLHRSTLCNASARDRCGSASPSPLVADPTAAAPTPAPSQCRFRCDSGIEQRPSAGVESAQRHQIHLMVEIALSCRSNL